MSERRTCEACLDSEIGYSDKKKEFNIRMCLKCKKMHCYQNDLKNCYIYTCKACGKDLCAECSFTRASCSKECHVKPWKL